MNRHRFYTVGLLVVLLAIAGNTLLTLNNVERVRKDEASTRTTAAHTRKVQIQGGPVAVCLLEVMKNVAPLLLKVPSVEAPLKAYVRLQSKRYPGVVCPSK
jgi:hypothetical protein